MLYFIYYPQTNTFAQIILYLIFINWQSIIMNKSLEFFRFADKTIYPNTYIYIIANIIITSSSCSFDKAADMQKRILLWSNGVAGKPTPTVAILNLLNARTVVLKLYNNQFKKKY